MNRSHGPWTINHSVLEFKGPLIEVWQDAVTKPEGKPGEYDTLRVKPGASILALDDDGCVYLAREFRYAIGRSSLEVVGGAIDEGEATAEAARRELLEELGIEADELIPLLPRRASFGSTKRPLRAASQGRYYWLCI